MPRKARELSPLEVRRLDQPGRWSVGGVDGLALQVTRSGARSWVLRLAVSGQQREMGLGSFPSVTLAEARDKARRHRAQVAEGSDPISLRRAAVSAAAADRMSQRTFAEVAAQYIEQHEKSWKNEKHAAQWASTLQTYAAPVIGQLLVRDVTSAHVIRALEPIWTTKTETATRVRSRIELVLDFAAARGLRQGPNPARWKGNLDAALPKASKVAVVQHHTAVAIDEVSERVNFSNKSFELAFQGVLDPLAAPEKSLYGRSTGSNLRLHGCPEVKSKNSQTLSASSRSHAASSPRCRTDPAGRRLRRPARR